MKTTETVNTKILLKSSFWYVVSNFLTRGLVFITTPIFTRLMTTKQYGDFSVFASWQSIFLVICGLEIYATLNRARFDYKEGGELDSYITSCLVLSSMITAAALALYLIFPDFFHNLFLLDRRYILIMFAYLFTQPVFLMFQAKQRVEYRYKFSSAISFALVVGSSLFAMALVYYMEGDRLFGRIIGQYVPYIFVGAIFYICFLKKSMVIRVKAWKYALTMGLPLVFSFLGSQILLNSDRVIVQHLCSSDEVAWLVLATTCAHIMLIFVQSLNNAWAPWFYDKQNNQDYSAIRKAFRFYMWFILFCTFGVLMIGPEIVRILGGKSYAESVYVLPANMLCGVFTAMTSQFVNLETFYKKPHYAATLTFIVAVINIGLDIVGVLLWGYRAACYVTVLCQLLLIVMHYIITIKMGIGKMLPVKDLAMELLVSIILILVSLILYQFTAVRWGFIMMLILCAGIAGVKKHREILRFIKGYRKV